MKLQGLVSTDFQGLNELKLQAKHDAREALPAVAKQFEGIFLQSMLKSMRMGQHFLDESSPFSGKNEATFQEMLDGQYSSTISNNKGIGLADMLAHQLQNKVGAHNEKMAEASGTTEHNILAVNTIASSKPGTSVTASKDSSHEIMDNFVKAIWPKAKEAASVIGLDPKILMAQAALETGWGKFVAKDSEGITSNNLFNVKTGSSKEFEAVNVNTIEYIAGTPIKKTESFRKYSSVEQSFNDYVSLITGSERYQNAVAHAGSPELYVNELHKAGYATDPQYGTKILSIYHGEDLNQAMQRCGLSDQI